MSLVFKNENRKIFLILSFILTLKALFLIFLITHSQIALAPDEAQYWTWSQTLDFGYYSKPPAVAWQIFLTTFFLGNTELGIRFGAVMIGFILPCVLYFIALGVLEKPWIAFWSGIAFAFSPLGFYLSFAATTDGGAILFLTLAIWATLKEKGPNFLIAGFFIFLGMLYKWTAFVYWPALFAFSFFYPHIRKREMFWGLLISLCAFLPTLYWNSHHEWATFRHIGKTVAQTQHGNFIAFLASQIGLFSPLFFALFILSFFFLLREKNWKLNFCAALPFLFIFFIGASFFKKMQANWIAFLYPTAFILIAWIGSRKKIWAHAGTYTSCAIVLFLFSIPTLQARFPLSYTLNPFRQSMGWQELPEILERVGYSAKEHFLFGDKYQTASVLSFYSEGQKRAYFFNISETRKNQFSYWPQMDVQEVGKNGYFIVLENEKATDLDWYEKNYLKKLSPYFEHVEFAGAFPIFCVKEIPVKYALIFKCNHFSGSMPEAISHY